MYLRRLLVHVLSEYQPLASMLNFLCCPTPLVLLLCEPSYQSIEDVTVQLG